MRYSIVRTATARLPDSRVRYADPLRKLSVLYRVSNCVVETHTSTMGPLAGAYVSSYIFPSHHLPCCLFLH
jgi:hypothetical protein